jgi:hypothetical protein
MIPFKVNLRTTLFFAFILPGCAQLEALAQREYIVVEKVLSDKQVAYSSGDEISYKLKYEDFFRSDHIVALNDTAIEFHYNVIPYHEIGEINIKGQRFGKANWRGMGSKVQFIGLAYIAIDQFNQVVVRREDASFNQNVWLAGGLIFAGGTIMKILTPRKLKLGGKYRIRYVNLMSY